jgi:hypothetical protein
MNTLNESGRAQALARQPLAVQMRIHQLMAGADVVLERACNNSEADEAFATAETNLVEALQDALVPLSEQIQRANVGARLALLLIERPWVESFTLQVAFETVLGDGSDVYDMTMLYIEGVSVNAKRCDPIHADDQGQFHAEVAADEMVCALETWESDIGKCLLFRSGAFVNSSDVTVVDVRVERSACEVLLAQPRVSGLAVWTALFTMPAVAQDGVAGEAGHYAKGAWCEPKGALCSEAVFDAMSASAEELAANFIEQLCSDGYRVHEGDVSSDAELATKWWFTWCVPGMVEAEVGPTCASEQGAWGSALAHRLANSEIPVDRI